MCKLLVIINAHQIKKFMAYEALPILELTSKNKSE